MKHALRVVSLASVLVTAAFGLTNGGCASVATPAHTARAVPGPIHFDAPRDDSRESALLAHESRAAAAKGDAPAVLYPPEVVHEARIELAREALDADNQAKAEAEEAEQMQRDIASAQDAAAASARANRSTR